jgi:hypothetical protein
MVGQVSDLPFSGPNDSYHALMERLDRSTLEHFRNYHRPPLAYARGSVGVFLNRDRKGAIYANCENALASLRLVFLADSLDPIYRVVCGYRGEITKRRSYRQGEVLTAA